MKIKFLGAAGTVTGSCYALTSASGSSILIDMGMFQGPPNIEKLNREPFDFDASLLTGVVLTHAHLDHCGRLPILLQKGFKGKIWMTPPTKDLTELSLLDTAKINNGKNGNKTLFNRDQAVKTIMRFETIDYRTPFTIGDFTTTFRDAGHIMGSASLEIEDKKPNSQIKKVIFSGDLGNSPEPLVEKTETIDRGDAVIMESTYGGRLHPEGDSVGVIKSEITEIQATKGTLLIPAFSLERTQELLHLIMHLKKNGEIPIQLPVYLDSPMAQRATSIYLNHKNNFNPHIQNDLKVGSPFIFPGFSNVEGIRESKALYEDVNPKVIIAGSGMMTGGRIVEHAAHYLPIISTRLLIVGFQGEATLGRELLEGSKKVTIDGMSIDVKATVTSIKTMSSHADQAQLMNWLKNIKNVKKVFLTHGEDEPRKILAQKIQQDIGIKDISLPTLNQELQF